MQTGYRTHKSASLIVSVCRALPKRMRKATMEIAKLHTPAETQRRGHATALMHKVCAEADEDGLTLVLWPHPYANVVLSPAQLADWYTRRFGFIVLPGLPTMMARVPSAERTPVSLAAEAAC